MEKKVITDTRDVPKKMAAKADKNGIIQVQLHREAAIEKLSTNIYTDPKAGIREYINNEARPCREAIKLWHNASIYVTVKPNDRTIIIEGRESMGMTMDVFENVYAVLGRSGNFDPRESGQFGLGRASYVCLSDMMIFETYSRETDEKFGFVGKGGKVYEPIPENHLSIKQYGTKVTFTVREKKINLYDLITYIKEIGKFLAVPVFLDLAEYIPVCDDTSDSFRDHANGIVQLGPVNMRDYLREYACVLDQEIIEIDADDYHFICVLSNHHHFHGIRDTRLIGMPIDVIFNSPLSNIMPLTKYMINIKNERKYMPTSSRDSLTAESIKLLKSNLRKDIDICLSKIRIEDMPKCKWCYGVCMSDHHHPECDDEFKHRRDSGRCVKCGNSKTTGMPSLSGKISKRVSMFFRDMQVTTTAETCHSLHAEQPEHRIIPGIARIVCSKCDSDPQSAYVGYRTEYAERDKAIIS